MGTVFSFLLAMLSYPIGGYVQLKEAISLPDFQSRRVKALYYQDGLRTEIDRSKPHCGITFSGRESFEWVYRLKEVPAETYVLKSKFRATVEGEFLDYWTLRSLSRDFEFHLYCLDRDTPPTLGDIQKHLGGPEKITFNPERDPR